MAKLKVTNLSFSYGKQCVLNDLSLEFVENKVNVILGVNGSGKTTLLKLICGLLEIKTGDIMIDNIHINQIQHRLLSRKVSYVKQLSKNNTDFTVLDYLLFGLVNRVKFYNTPSRKQVAEVKDIAKKMKIDKLLYKNMNNLSGGEKQLVLICASIIQDTDIILLDEPLSALDLKNQKEVLNLLNSINNKTIIMTTHNPNICLHLDAHIILLKNGNIIKMGNCEEVITPEVLGCVYGDILMYVKDSDYNEITIK